MSDHSRPCKRRRRNSVAAQQLQSAADLDDLNIGSRWDGAHSGLTGEHLHQHAPSRAFNRVLFSTPAKQSNAQHLVPI